MLYTLFFTVTSLDLFITTLKTFFTVTRLSLYSDHVLDLVQHEDKALTAWQYILQAADFPAVARGCGHCCFSLHLLQHSVDSAQDCWTAQQMLSCPTHSHSHKLRRLSHNLDALHVLFLRCSTPVGWDIPQGFGPRHLANTSPSL